MNITSQEFGNKIRELRKEKGFSIRQVALQSGVSNPFLSQVENARRSIPKPSTLEKIAHGLRVDKSVIFQMAGIVDNIPNELPISSTPSTVSIPIYGRISAGYPEGAKEDIEGNVKIDDELIERYGKDNLIGLRVNGESMNKVVPNGAVAILAKVDTSEITNDDICGVIIDGDSATLKHVYIYPDRIRFEPDSWLTEFKPFEYKKSDIENGEPPVQIIGKLVEMKSRF